ncbi:MAG: tRNA (N6-isopentenyl adenosine(37)-C2)-methylthiotransferase MiaB, partial [Anaerovoracaceae bacterium]
MNERDSETLGGLLEHMGYKSLPMAKGDAKTQEAADIHIINTCSVRENADQRFFGTLGQLKNQKKKNPNMIIGVCGCMMQQQHITDTIKSKYPWVDIIFGTHNIHNFPKLLENTIAEKKKIIEVWEDSAEIVENLPSKRLYEFKSFVNIMNG